MSSSSTIDNDAMDVDDVDSVVPDAPPPTAVPPPAVVAAAPPAPKRRGRKKKIEPVTDGVLLPGTLVSGGQEIGENGRPNPVVRQGKQAEAAIDRRGMFWQHTHAEPDGTPRVVNITCSALTHLADTSFSQYQSHDPWRDVTVSLTHEPAQYWPTSSTMPCHLDQEEFDGPPVLIPRHYNDRTRTFTNFYGNFCSFACAKRWLAERFDHDAHMQLMFLAHLAREVFRVPDSVQLQVAPSSLRLKRYGGTLTAKEFRALSEQCVYDIVHEPIFVSHFMVLECQQQKQQHPQQNHHTTASSSSAAGVLGGAISHNVQQEPHMSRDPYYDPTPTPATLSTTAAAAIALQQQHPAGLAALMSLSNGSSPPSPRVWSLRGLQAFDKQEQEPFTASSPAATTATATATPATSNMYTEFLKKKESSLLLRTADDQQPEPSPSAETASVSNYVLLPDEGDTDDLWAAALNPSSSSSSSSSHHLQMHKHNFGPGTTLMSADDLFTDAAAAPPSPYASSSSSFTPPPRSAVAMSGPPPHIRSNAPPPPKGEKPPGKKRGRGRPPRHTSYEPPVVTQHHHAPAVSQDIHDSMAPAAQPLSLLNNNLDSFLPPPKRQKQQQRPQEQQSPTKSGFGGGILSFFVND